MGVAKELYFKMQEEQVNELPIETLAQLHRLGAEWRYYDTDKRKEFKSSGFQKRTKRIISTILKTKWKIII